MNPETISPLSGAPIAPLDDDKQTGELQRELARIGLGNDLFALTMKTETDEVITLGAQVVLLPIAFLETMTHDQSLGEETMTLGLRQAVEFLRPHGPTLLLAESLLSLARATRGYVSHENELELVLEAIGILQSLDTGRRLGRAFLQLGMILRDAGQYYHALHAFENARQVCTIQQDSGGLSAIDYNRAFVCRSLRQNIEALQLLTQAENELPHVRAAASWQKQILSERIFNLMQLRRADEAMSLVDTWIAQQDGQYVPYLVRGDIHTQRGEPVSALQDYCEAALALSRGILSRRTERFQRFDRGRHQAIFDRSLAAALQTGEAEIAMVLLELANTGGLGLQNPGGEEPSAETLQKKQDLRRRAGEVTAEALIPESNPDAAVLARLQERADWLVSEWEFLNAGQRRIPTSFENIRQTAQQIIHSLPVDTLILEFFLAEGQVWVLGITANSIEAHPTGLTEFDVTFLTRAFRYECMGRFPNTALERLSIALVGPFSAQLKTKDRLMVLLGPYLQGIPFQALLWQGQPLIETFIITYLHSGLSAIAASAGGATFTSQTSCTFIGVPQISYAPMPNLPGVYNEIANIQRLFAAPTLHIDPPAAACQLLELSGSIGVLHLSCHGLYEARAPLLSRLLLADRPVFAFEITLSGLKTQLAVLSACQTAEGLMQPGGYIQSLSSAFLKTGVGAVIAALWPVDDHAASTFTDLFYQKLLDGRQTPVSALNAAQRELRRRPGFDHPYFWAPFCMFSA